MSKIVSVCQIMGDYNYGGITNFVTQLSFALGQDFKVTVLCQHAIKGLPHNFELIELKPKNTVDLWRKLKNLGDFDIIHCHDIYALPGLVSGQTKAKVIYTHHGVVPLKYSRANEITGWMLAYLCGKYAIPRVDLAVAISDYTLAELKGRYHAQKLVKIPDGINVDKFQARANKLKSQGHPRLLYVGLVEKHKGVRFLVNAMPYVIKEFPEASLVVVGNGRDLSFLEESVMRMGLTEEVSFPGFVQSDSLVDYINDCDIHVEAAYWHSFGIPIIEAMACGKPVVTRDAYAMREHIINSGAGVLFRRDDPGELVSAIKNVMSNYANYASRARKYTEKFSLALVAQQYAQAYLSLLQMSK